MSSKIEFTQNLDQNTLLLLLLLLLQRLTERFRCVKLCANHLLAFFNYSSRRNTFANSVYEWWNWGSERLQRPCLCNTISNSYSLDLNLRLINACKLVHFGLLLIVSSSMLPLYALGFTVQRERVLFYLKETCSHLNHILLASLLLNLTTPWGLGRDMNHHLLRMYLLVLE